VIRALLLALLAGTAQAEALRYCDQPVEPSAVEQDRLLAFGALIKTELERSGQDLALVARSGLDLQRIGHRYSHAGLSLRVSANTPWSVRQLYYACDERKPRIFDQGMAGFVLGTAEPRLGYVSLVFLPDEPGALLTQAALDDRRALQLLAGRYSANAYAYGERYLNCNQWLAELLALAWSGGPPEMARGQAQAWLQDQGYAPSVIDVGGWALLGVFVPWLHNDDHPEPDRTIGRYRVSMPAALEQFVRQRVPGASRVELCHRDGQAVIRRGWEPLAEDCRPGPGDELIAL